MHAVRWQNNSFRVTRVPQERLNEELSVFSYDCFVIPVTYVSLPHATFVCTIAVGQVPTL